MSRTNNDIGINIILSIPVPSYSDLWLCSSDSLWQISSGAKHHLSIIRAYTSSWALSFFFFFFCMCRSIWTMKSSSLWILSSTKRWCGWTSSKSIDRPSRYQRNGSVAPRFLLVTGVMDLYSTLLFMWPTVHPPGWRGEAGPGRAAGHRRGCRHPPPSGEEAARALPGLHGLHHQRVRDGAFNRDKASVLWRVVMWLFIAVINVIIIRSTTIWSRTVSKQKRSNVWLNFTEMMLTAQCVCVWKTLKALTGDVCFSCLGLNHFLF